MKKLKYVMFVSMAIAAIVSSCGKKEEKKEAGKTAGQLTHEYALTMCEKMVGCTEEMLKDMPEAQRAMVKQHMPSKEKCLEQANKAADEDKDAMEMALTNEEIQAARACLEDIQKLDCKSISAKNTGENCQKFQSLMINRHQG